MAEATASVNTAATATARIRTAVRVTIANGLRGLLSAGELSWVVFIGKIISHAAGGFATPNEGIGKHENNRVRWIPQRPGAFRTAMSEIL
jgi:hypothetical protein